MFTIGDQYQFVMEIDKVKRGQIQHNFTVGFDDRVGFHAFKSENFSDNWHWKLRLIFSAQRDGLLSNFLASTSTINKYRPCPQSLPFSKCLLYGCYIIVREIIRPNMPIKSVKLSF